MAAAAKPAGTLERGVSAPLGPRKKEARDLLPGFFLCLFQLQRRWVLRCVGLPAGQVRAVGVQVFGKVGPIAGQQPGQLPVPVLPGPPAAAHGLEHVPQLRRVEGPGLVPRQLPVQEVQVGRAAAQLQLIFTPAGPSLLEHGSAANVIAQRADDGGNIVDAAAFRLLVGGGGQQPAVNMGDPVQPRPAAEIGPVPEGVRRDLAQLLYRMHA